jgi:hypothetical protein
METKLLISLSSYRACQRSHELDKRLAFSLRAYGLHDRIGKMITASFCISVETLGESDTGTTAAAFCKLENSQKLNEQHRRAQ